MNNIQPDLHIRPATEQDNVFLEKLYGTTRPDLLLLGLPDNLIEMQFRAQQTSYRTQFPNAEHSIVEKDAEAIGYLIVDKTGDTIRLIYIALLPEQRNLGYGRRLIQALQHEASRTDKLLALSVDPQNLPAKHLYFSLGFLPCNDHGVNLEMQWAPNRPR